MQVPGLFQTSSFDRMMVTVLNEHLRMSQIEGLMKGTSESILVNFTNLKYFPFHGKCLYICKTYDARYRHLGHWLKHSIVLIQVHMMFWIQIYDSK